MTRSEFCVAEERSCTALAGQKDSSAGNALETGAAALAMVRLSKQMCSKNVQMPENEFTATGSAPRFAFWIGRPSDTGPHRVPDLTAGQKRRRRIAAFRRIKERGNS
ncbi:hypothetical protein [Amaricoccus macauensis]|uniref:hypothetical protein n=1 Tax=Amaricoccus macauensis TaxID=57001 RepID=UPI003C7C7B49